MIDSEIKDAVLDRYLSKCKYKHASLFFEWRRKRRRVRVKKCVEVLANLRLKINFMEEGLRQKLLGFGIEGMVQIEEKKLKFFDRPPIETLEELQVRGPILTNFSNDDNSYSQRDQASSDRLKEEKKGGSKKKAKKGKSGMLDSDDKNQSSS
jgi:hypothetical protein